MKWSDGGPSADLEDRRGGGGGGLKLGLGGTLVLGVLSLFFHRDLFSLLGVAPSTGGGSSQSSAPAQDTPEQKKLVSFVSFVIDDIQKTWTKILPGYTHAKLVLFDGQVASACGRAESAMGPFYCPGDQRVYIDLAFYRELQSRFGAPGDFAQAYVIAHEVGHHVQNLTGIEAKMREAQERAPQQRNALSVKLELQADCYAGVWANSTQQRGILDAGDVQEALGAAAAVGDDRLQKASTGTVQPERWTHGSSAERMRWFKRGFDGGKPDACDTFAAP